MTKDTNPHQSLMNATLCAEFGLTGALDAALTDHFGSAMVKALNAGFEAGKRGDAPLVEINHLRAEHEVDTMLSGALADQVSEALCRAFQDGYRQGRSISAFRAG